MPLCSYAIMFNERELSDWLFSPGASKQKKKAAALFLYMKYTKDKVVGMADLSSTRREHYKQEKSMTGSNKEEGILFLKVAPAVQCAILTLHCSRKS